MKKCNQAISKIVSACLLFMSISVTVFAQTVVTGKVTNSSNGLPVVGATVTIKGTDTRTQTNSSGEYSIKVSSLNAVLVFTSVGYNMQQVVASNAANVVLSEAAQKLEDIVVVAYGTRKKTDLTGSVTAVSSKDFQKGNIASSEQLLQGKVAGLEVTTGGGSAGGGSKLRIRGGASLFASNDPLIVIDGVPVEGNGIAGSANLLNTINPNDIESMSVLKDASATALYGARATNGVVIISTKKGTSRKPVFNFNTKISMGSVANKAKVLSADEVRNIVNSSGNNTYIPLLGSANTDWQDQIYQSALGFDNNISVAGKQRMAKDFELPYRLSLGYLTQDGVLKTNNFKRLTTAINLSPKFLDNHLSLNINAKLANTKNRFADEGAIGTAITFDPTKPVNSGVKKYGGFWEWELGGSPLGLAPRNPLGLLELRNNRSTVNRFIGNIQVDYKFHFFPDLHFLANIGMDRSHGEGKDIVDSTSVVSVLSFSNKGRLTKYNQTKTSKLADVQLFYEKEFSAGNKIDVLVGHGYQEFFTSWDNFPTYFQNGTLNTGEAAPLYPDDKNGFAIDSYLGRMNLTLADKYLITASIRRDASSKFAKDKRVGYFPAVALAWKLKDEFFKNTSVLTDLKLRASWGTTGQQDGIALNYYLPIYYQGQNSAQFEFGGQYYNNYRPTAFNSDLKWETTETSNLGLDFGFIQNRVTGSIDVYQKKTKDLLSYIDVAPGANFDITILKNVGNLENKGVEFTINTVPVKTQKLIWDFGFNISYNKTEITKLNQQQGSGYKGILTSGISGGTGNNIGILAVGYAPYTFLPYTQVYGQDGKPIEGLYDDIDRDGVVTETGDRNYFKKPAPDYMFGISTGVTIKDFTLSIAGHGMLGNYLYNNFNSENGVLRNILNPVLYIGNASVNYNETHFSNNRYLSNYYIENASFFKLDNINLGYNLGKVINNKTNLRVNASIQNVFVITKYSGADPENASSSGVDNNIYPRPRIFSFGANLDF